MLSNLVNSLQNLLPSSRRFRFAPLVVDSFGQTCGVLGLDQFNGWAYDHVMTHVQKSLAKLFAFIVWKIALRKNALALSREQ